MSSKISQPPLVDNGTWAASTAVKAGVGANLPNGRRGVRVTAGTTRATFDTTERALWVETGDVVLPARAVTGNTTAVWGEDLEVSCAGGAVVVTPPVILPGATRFSVRKTDSTANLMTLTGTINGDPTGATGASLNAGGVFTVAADGVTYKLRNANAGPSGPTGGSGLTGSTGPAPFTTPAAWSSTTAYTASPLPASAVTYNGSTYVAIAASTNSQPDINPSNWTRIVSKGDQGTTGPGGIGLQSIYGNGSDGALVLDGTNTYTFLTKSGNDYTMTRDTFATDITISAGCRLLTASFALFGTGTLSGAGTVAGNGKAAAVGTAGGSTTGTYTGSTGKTGGTGVGVAATAVNTAAGGSSGLAGSGTSGAGGAAAAAAATATIRGSMQKPGAFTLGGTPISQALTFFVGGVAGGSGAGDGTNVGGGGGAGGLYVGIASRFISGTLLLQAKGGNGGVPAAGNCGGGAAGCGGVIHTLTETPVGGSVTFDVTPGTPGTGTGTGTAAAASGSGYVLNQLVV